MWQCVLDSWSETWVEKARACVPINAWVIGHQMHCLVETVGRSLPRSIQQTRLVQYWIYWYNCLLCKWLVSNPAKWKYIVIGYVDPPNISIFLHAQQYPSNEGLLYFYKPWGALRCGIEFLLWDLRCFPNETKWNIFKSIFLRLHYITNRACRELQCFT